MKSSVSHLPLIVALVFQIGATLPVSAESAVSSNCTYNGERLSGKVQFVDSFPDFEVKVVTSFPDLKVEQVTSFPDECGQWQIVDSFPDFTVKRVDSFPDFTIQYVKRFPGLP
ncbi:MAG: hypothetical protein AAF224_12185 [Pseudomonadota bacterium]